MRARYLVRLIGLALFLGLLPLAATAAQPSNVAETVGNADPVAPSAPAAPSDWSIPQDILWDNGPLVTHPGGGAGGLDASALQTALGLLLYGFGDQFDAGNRMADDFVVDAAGGWQIDAITFFAYQTNAPANPSPITAVYYQIWDGVPGEPGSSVVFGDLTTNRLTGTSFANLYRVPDYDLLNTGRKVFANTASAGVLLPTGRYWLDWTTDGSTAYTGPWAPPVSILGETSTGDGLQYTLADGWQAALDGTYPQGLPFIVQGSVVGADNVFAYINQPWDWVDGVADPASVIDATLKRGGSVIATSSTTSDAAGLFSLQFLSGGSHIDLLVGDQVILLGGGLDATLSLIDIAGSIDVVGDQVVGKATGGDFPAQGVASAGWPSNLSFTTVPVDFAADGSFVADFGGILDLTTDDLAKVQYADPQGNQVVQCFNPEGLDIRALISEGRIEGVTTPGATVSVLVSDADGPKGSATTAADATGSYSTPVYDRGQAVRLALGDHVEVKNSKQMRSTSLTMFHVSTIRPWDDRVVGNILGINFPPEGGMGRVDLWSVAQQRWYTQYVGIGQYGEYGADFSGVVDVAEPDMVRVWATTPDGNQQAALGWGLDLAASLSDDVVSGFTVVSSTVEISLYRGLVGDEPVGLLGTATTTAQTSSFFSSMVFSNSLPVGVSPSNVAVVRVGDHQRTLFVGRLGMVADVALDRLTISGPPNVVAHLEVRRQGVLREDAPYQADYAWREITLDAAGTGTADLAPYDLLPGDWVDVTAYGPEAGAAVHSLLAVPSGPLTEAVYLPLLLKNWP
jgi:hypothetical protein